MASAVLVLGLVLILAFMMGPADEEPGAEQMAQSSEGGIESPGPPSGEDRSGSPIEGQPTASFQSGGETAGSTSPEKGPVSVSRSSSSEAPRQQAASATRPQTGTLTWTGQLNTNTILVISEDKASFGSLNGSLPGVPVKIEVEPASVKIRQAPSSDNDWSRIMLHNGDERLTTVTIRWTSTK